MVGSDGEMIGVKTPVNVSVASDPPPANVLVWERSGHHGDETDCIICSVAAWLRRLLGGRTEKQAAG